MLYLQRKNLKEFMPFFLVRQLHMVCFHLSIINGIYFNTLFVTCLIQELILDLSNENVVRFNLSSLLSPLYFKMKRKAQVDDKRSMYILFFIHLSSTDHRFITINRCKAKTKTFTFRIQPWRK